MQIELQKMGKGLSSRSKAIEFLGSLNFSDQKIITLDFTGVETITPSFAHEMLSIVLKGEKDRRVNFKNTNESIVFQLKKALISIRGAGPDSV